MFTLLVPCLESVSRVEKAMNHGVNDLRGHTAGAELRLCLIENTRSCLFNQRGRSEAEKYRMNSIKIILA